jgi:sec-independent protein translocase protein TatA
MGFGNLGFTEIMIILVLVLLLFGAKRLPEIGASMGKGIREFKKSISDVDRQLNEPPRADRNESLRPAEPASTSAERPKDGSSSEPKRLLS